jgi:hypothetical protein
MKKILLIITMAFTLNANAGGDIFNDVGEWINNNKTMTAVIGVGVAGAAVASIKPISMLLEGSEKEILTTGEVSAKIEQMKSFDLAASKLQVGENQVMVVGDALTKEQIASMSASLAKAEKDIDESLAKADKISIKKADKLIERNAFKAQRRAQKADKQLLKGETNAQRKVRQAKLMAEKGKMEGALVTDIPTDADILQSLRTLKNQEVKAGATGASDAVLNKGKDFSISPSSSSSSLYEMEWDANTDDMIVMLNNEKMDKDRIVDFLANTGGNFDKDIT